MAPTSIRPVLAVLLALVPLTGAAADGEGKKARPRLTFEDDIRPIFMGKCADCHDPDVEAGGLDLTRYAAAMAGGSSGEVIRPGDAEGSKLFRQVSHQESPFMPPESGKIKAELLKKLRRWIDEGAAENKRSPKLKKAAPKPKPAATPAKAIRSPARPLQPLSLEPVLATEKPQAVTALAASPSAPLIAAASYRQVLLLKASDLSLHGILPFPEGQPHVLKFSADGRALIAAGGRGAHSGSVVVFDVATGQRLGKVGAERDVVLAADVDPHLMRVVLGGPTKVLKVFSLDTGELLYRKKRHTGWVTAAAFSPDGVLIASGDRNGGIYVWEADTGREFLELRGHSARVSALSWRADANALASASADRSIRIWRTEDGAGLRRWNAHGGGVRAMSFGRDGRLASVGDDLRAKVWNQNGKAERQVVLKSLPLTVDRSFDGARIIAGQLSGALALHDAKSGKLLATAAVNPPTIAARLAALDQSSAKLKAEAGALQAALAKAREVEEAARAAVELARPPSLEKSRELEELTARLAAAVGKRKELRQRLKEARASAKVAPKSGVDGAPPELDAEAYAEIKRRIVRLEAEEVEAGRVVAKLTGRRHTADKAARAARAALAPLEQALKNAEAAIKKQSPAAEASQRQLRAIHVAAQRWRAEAGLASAEARAREQAKQLAARTAELKASRAALDEARREEAEARSEQTAAAARSKAAVKAQERATAMAERGRAVAEGAAAAAAGLESGVASLERAAKAASELAGEALFGPGGKPDPAAPALWDNSARARALLEHQRSQLALARGFLKSSRSGAAKLAARSSQASKDRAAAEGALAAAEARLAAARSALTELAAQVKNGQDAAATLRRSTQEAARLLDEARDAVRPLRP